jgi:hypothetical protein
MQRDTVSKQLSARAFEFFFWFSRFEFALKENGFLESHTQGVAAKPGWDDFVVRWRDSYKLTHAARRLLVVPPDRQIVGAGDLLTWKPVGLDDCTSELQKVVRLLKILRNNLFHGGKHGGAGWDDAARAGELLLVGLSVLNELAEMSSLKADYEQSY